MSSGLRSGGRSAAHHTSRSVAGSSSRSSSRSSSGPRGPGAWSLARSLGSSSRMSRSALGRGAAVGHGAARKPCQGTHQTRGRPTSRRCSPSVTNRHSRASSETGHPTVQRCGSRQHRPGQLAANAARTLQAVRQRRLDARGSRQCGDARGPKRGAAWLIRDGRVRQGHHHNVGLARHIFGSGFGGSGLHGGRRAHRSGC